MPLFQCTWIIMACYVKNDKNSNPDIHFFIENGMRGGISYVSKRYDKYCPDYDDKKPINNVTLM